jgi:AraC-like DNA-binding protein
MLTDCRSGSLRLERSLTRISRDRNRDFVFHVFLEGSANYPSTCAPTRRSQPASGKLLVLDLNRPFHMHRQACRLISLFAPGELLKDSLADPEALHGRIIDDSPLARLLLAHFATLAGSIGKMTRDDAASAIREGTSLLAAAFGKQAGLSGNARAAARAAMLRQARRYVQAHVHETDLLPEKVCSALSLPRRSLYRLFEHEGGLNAYIRHAKLRCAADELNRYTTVPVAQIAYGLGFKSPSDFTRAFRRSFGMSPQEFRAQSHVPAKNSRALA